MSQKGGDSSKLSMDGVEYDVAQENPFPRDFDRNHLDLDLLRNWRKTCASSHGACCNNPKLDVLQPSLKSLFLIDVQSLCLVSASLETKFIALSYVWGSIPMFKIRKLDISFLCSPGSLATDEIAKGIPNTVRDAIYLTNLLGERYLFVDHLCVPQDGDSIEEYLRNMAAIYACADFTIVDAAGANANHGLRGIGGPSQNRANDVPTEKPIYSQLRAYPWSSVWASRGWTFQESAFSRRLLIFDGLVSWVCGRCHWYEEWQQTSELKTITAWPQNREHLGVPVNLTSILPKIPSLGRWGMLVENFNDRSLTYESDALAAFSGTIEVMSKTFPGGIFFGLPEFFFDIALLWTPAANVSRREEKDRLTGRTLPSWSWLGWDGAVDCLASWSQFQTRIYREDGLSTPWIPRVRLIPLAKWYKVRIRDKERVPIHNSYHKFERLREATEEELPTGWNRHHHPDGDYFAHEFAPFSKFSYPIPIVDGLSLGQDFEFESTLICVASQSMFVIGKPTNAELLSTSVVHLTTRSGAIVGCLGFSDVEFSDDLEGFACELIAVSEGHVLSPERIEDEYGNSSDWAIKEWNLASSHEEPVADELCYKFYNVFWVQWRGNVAYRKGLGRVGKTAWDRSQPRRIEFNLG